MSITEKIIDFQNKAEKEFENKKNIATLFKYLLAMVTFFSSTIFAAFTLPFRYLFKQLSTKKNHSQIYIGNNKNIDSLLKKEELVLIDFWAEWCGPCIMMNSTIKEFSENSKHIKVIKINADMNMKTLKRFNVRGLPHFLLIKNEKEVKRFAGSMTLNDLNSFCFED